MLSGLVLMQFSLLGESFKVFTTLRFCDREFNPEKSVNCFGFQIKYSPCDVISKDLCLKNRPKHTAIPKLKYS